MSLKHIILALTEEPVTGYVLNQVIEETIRLFWPADQAQLYRSLKQLEQAGFLKRHVLGPDKGPARKTYQRTTKGHHELVQWLKSDPVFSVERSAYVAQLVFLHEAADLEVTISFVEKLRKRFKESLDRFEAIEAEESLQPVSSLPLDDLHGFLGLKLAIDTTRARLDWCSWAIATLRRRMRKQAT